MVWDGGWGGAACCCCSIRWILSVSLNENTRLSRCGAAAKESFETHLKNVLVEVEDKMPATALSKKDRAIATIALCVGGMMLARAVNDEKFSDQILLACRRMATPQDEK